MLEFTTDPTGDPTTAPILSIEVLGSFRWSLGAEPLPNPSPVGMAALAYLLSHPEERVSHDEMEALFSPAVVGGPGSWATEAEQLRRLVPAPFLTVTSRSIRLSSAVRSDIAEAGALSEARTTSSLQRAWLLLGSELLADLALVNCPLWNVWLQARRMRLRKSLRRVTDQLGAQAIDPTVHGRRRTTSIQVH